EVSGKYDYAPQSYLVAGYAYTMEETSDTLRFNDSRLHRWFSSIQHSVTALTVASATVAYEPARLLGRRGQVDISERTWRIGAAITYLPNRRWTMSLNYDYDHVRSEDPFRKLRRGRVGLSAAYT